MVHLASEAAATTSFAGIPISTPEQCFLEIAAAGADLVELVVLGDSLVKKSRTTPQRLVDAAESSRSYRVRTARRAARLVREGVDSPMESRLRMLIVLAGLPEPKVNLVLWTADGRYEFRFDLWYEEYRLIVEYDGDQHATDPQQRKHDLLRREELDRRDLRMLVFISGDVYKTPSQTLERIHRGLVDRGAKGLRPRFREEWRRYFPGQS
jgi:very-short-patch-repair endonuclease